ncbi:MAG: polysaccharide deacetylase family protein [bacterium]|nr:MAG: polysaccharide deacetylase family protein [bacterium]
MKTRGVPIVMYHGTGPYHPGWPWGHLRTPLDVFEGQMRALAEEGWTTISLDTLYAHLADNASLPEKPVVLTFDDGYLDNWVNAYPILRRYGHRAVIWMSTDFVDPCNEPRPTLDDLDTGRIGESDLNDMGYLSWTEMRRMVESGHFEIQSHGMTHTWYFKGPEIIDFHRPSGVDGYVRPPWLAWNLFPECKHVHPLTVPDDRIPYGTPIYTFGKSLVTRRYFEDPGLTARLVGRVAAGGGAAFFERAGWRDELLGVVRKHPPCEDRIESEEEYEARVKNELAVSMRLIEEALGSKVRYLCWPGGGRTPKTLRIAQEVGYRSTTTHYLDPDRRNTYGQNPHEFNRIGCASPWVWRGRRFYRTDPGYFIAFLEYFAGQKNSIWTIRRYKLHYVLRYYLRGIS